MKIIKSWILSVYRIKLVFCSEVSQENSWCYQVYLSINLVYLSINKKLTHDLLVAILSEWVHILRSQTKCSLRQCWDPTVSLEEPHYTWCSILCFQREARVIQMCAGHSVHSPVSLRHQSTENHHRLVTTSLSLSPYPSRFASSAVKTSERRLCANYSDRDRISSPNSSTNSCHTSWS